MINIFSEGTLSNRNREDSKQVGAALGVLYHNGREWKHAETIFGESVTENDTALRSFVPVLDVLADFMETQLNDSKCKHSHIPILKLHCKQSAGRLTTRGAGSFCWMPAKNR